VPQTNLKDGKEPVWNETYTLPVHVKEHQALTAIMYDSVRALLLLCSGNRKLQLSEPPPCCHA